MKRCADNLGRETNERSDNGETPERLDAFRDLAVCRVGIPHDFRYVLFDLALGPFGLGFGVAGLLVLEGKDFPDAIFSLVQ